jgi:hypothetical protein
LEDYYSFHTSNTIRPNFNEFHRIFQKSTVSVTSDFFLLGTNFQTLLKNQVLQETSSMGGMGGCVVLVNELVCLFWSGLSRHSDVSQSKWSHD